jgi:LDH2 family malate/lactate/ureidoglycolate dehydrogenase
MVWSDLRGHATQGVYLLPILVKRLGLGLVRSPADMTLERTGPATARLDAAHGFGQVAGRRAMDEAVELARTQGIGICTVRNSNHYGAAGYYAARATESGFVGLTFSNSMPKVAPHGGTRRLMGTNPLGFACPRAAGDAPLVIDLATGASAGSRISHARRTGQPIPEGIALDAEGRPTTDPNDVDAGGCLLPAGGAKGYCLGLIVEVMSGVLTGSAFAPGVGSMFRNLDTHVRAGHTCVAIDIARFLPLDEFRDRMEELAASIKAVPPVEGADEVMIPGERRARLADERTRRGILLSPPLVNSLAETADKLGTKPPWE